MEFKGKSKQSKTDIYFRTISQFIQASFLRQILYKDLKTINKMINL